MTRFPVLVTAFVLVVTACGAGASPAPRLSNVAAHTHPSLHAIAAARKRVAARKAQKLVQRVVLPRGARRIAQPPVLTRGDTGVSVIHETAYRHAFWRVRASLGTVFAFVKAHPPPGFTYYGGGGLYRSLDFDNNRPGVKQRLLSVSLARVGDGTDIRVDAGVGWIYPRSPKEVLPAGVREIDIRDEHVARRVTDAAKVAHIVRWFDALNAAQPGPMVSCIAILNSRATFVFRSASGARLATAGVPSEPADGCDSIPFSIRGHRQIPLIDSTFNRYAFIHRVERLLELRLPKR